MSQLSQSWRRFSLALLLIAGAGLFLRARGGEVLPARLPVSAFPAQVDDWSGKDVVLDQSTLRVLGDGEFLQRIYFGRPDEPSVDFFLAYFPSQRTGSTMHSPKNCLPGSGWAPLESGRLEMQHPNGARLVVNRYIIGKGLHRQLVLYWYQAHGRVIASEYWAKIYLVTDSIRMNRSDGALIRVITPILPSEEKRAAEARAVAFAQRILPTLESYIPR